VPWCEDCSKFWNPNSLPPDGTCPTCGRFIADAPPEAKVPWHFWILIVALGIYLSWRAWQGIEWVIHR
jgi:hypothetical protein